VRTGLRANHAVGSKMARAFLGGRAERTGAIPLEKHLETTVKIPRSVRSEALDLGIKIGIETHGDLQAWEVRDLIEEAGKDFVGATIDTGNPVTLAEDPMVTLETLAPYALTTHIRDSAVFEHPRGAVYQWVALGDGSIDYAQFFERYRQLCPNCSVQLEILTGNAPQVLPYMGSMLIAGRGQRSPEYTAALKE
jgi:sugar phosphate isomerase/epimerase